MAATGRGSVTRTFARWVVGFKAAVGRSQVCRTNNARLRAVARWGARDRGDRRRAATTGGAPPQYPALIRRRRGDGVDAKGNALARPQGRALDFAATGADLARNSQDRGFPRVRGTSFAATLARPAAWPAYSGVDEAVPVRAIGRGIVCFTCRVDPKILRAR